MLMGDKVKEISVFVDESGTFDPDVEASRFYLVCMVFHDQVKSIADIVGLVGVDPESVSSNLSASHVDFEDSVQLSEAIKWNAETIVTRDKRGFSGSPIPVYAPADFISAFMK